MTTRREFIGQLSLSGLSLGMPLSFARAADDPYLAHVHPELRDMARKVMQFTAGPPLSAATLAERRAGSVRYARPWRKDVPVERQLAIVGKPHPDVVLYVVNAKPGTRRPAILHTHGGGFVTGSAEQAVGDLQETCAALDCVGVTVEYRLAPETTYAGSIEDNYAGLKWLYRNAEAIGADPARIAVAGESAGGGHAALLAITARDRGEVPVCFQCLTYPMLDDRTGSSRAVPAHQGQLIWNEASNRFGWESFLGMKPGGKRVPMRAVPARNPDLSRLPPAFIGVGGIDLFVDEDVEYARRLNDAGVPCELIVVPGAFHGFDGIAGTGRIGRWFDAARKDALRRGFGLAT